MSEWLVETHRARPPARARVIAIPWAGGGAAVYRPWASVLPADIALDVVRLPGRESRLREAPLTDMKSLIDLLAPIVAERIDVPTAVFGYSLGALIAYELVARIQEMRGPTAALLAVGGADGPHQPRGGPHLSELDDDRFLVALRNLQGTPAAVLDHAELVSLLLPGLRADFHLLDHYRPCPRQPLQVPISTFTGTEDTETTAAGVARWGEVTAAATSHRSFPGKHFFIVDAADAVVGAVVADLTAAVGGQPASTVMSARPDTPSWPPPDGLRARR